MIELPADGIYTVSASDWSSMKRYSYFAGTEVKGLFRFLAKILMEPVDIIFT